MIVQDVDLSAYRRSGGWIGHPLHYAHEVRSTNDVALAAARDGVAEGFVAIADVQTAGRGRLGRQWHAPARASLLLSILFRPPEPLATYASRVTMVCGLGLVEAVREATGASVQLKWPNDLITVSQAEDADWHKLAGMLTEVEPATGDLPASVVVGIGLNVNVPEVELGDLGPNATSLQALTRKEFDRALLLDRLLDAVECGYDRLMHGTDPLEAWRASLAWLGSYVVVCSPTECTAGKMEGVDDDGALLLRGPGEALRRIMAGDVSLRPFL